LKGQRGFEKTKVWQEGNIQRLAYESKKWGWEVGEGLNEETSRGREEGGERR